jgi:hypothetical protein
MQYTAFSDLGRKAHERWLGISMRLQLYKPACAWSLLFVAMDQESYHRKKNHG